MLLRLTIIFLLIAPGTLLSQQVARTEVIQPIRNTSFNKEGACRERRQSGNPRQLNGYHVFDGSQDGNRQVDPQIAVGGDHVLHATNSGLVIYDKQGEFIQGVSQNCFNGGIDPKLFFDAHNGVFGFDLWNPWDEAKLKPVNISVSETNDPTGAWNTYPVPAPNGRDGGGIGYSLGIKKQDPTCSSALGLHFAYQLTNPGHFAIRSVSVKEKQRPKEVPGVTTAEAWLMETTNSIYGRSKASQTKTEKVIP